jgi:glycosyltransferase involved in cell wall biosynthesis
MGMRINLFTDGDCTDLNTWSGVPYYFHRNLLASSIDVRPFDLNPESAMYPIFNRIMTVRQRAIQTVRPAESWDPLRSRSFHLLVNRRLRNIVEHHSDVDLNVFLTFTFSTYPYAPVPVVHYCDRTYEHYLEDVGRTPTRKDHLFIDVERRNIENAALVLTTGKLCGDFIKSRYNAKRVFCLRAGARTDVHVLDPERLVAEKENSRDILFIGRGAHRRGVDILLKAFTMFNERNGNDFTLHLVGIQPNELPEELRAQGPSVKFYGFLDKTVSTDLQRYNKLLRSAKLFVMPMRPGPFPGVIKEVQLHCTPVIVCGMQGVSETLIHDHDSVLVDSLQPEAFAGQMERLVKHSSVWRQLALNAHFARQSCTWSNTVGEFMEIVRGCDLLKN